MNFQPMIQVEFVEMVEEMRKAQKEYFELATGKDGHNQRFALTRVLQRAKAFEKKVDNWIVLYHDDLKKWKAFAGQKKHSEEQAVYEAKPKDGE